MLDVLDAVHPMDRVERFFNCPGPGHPEEVGMPFTQRQR
jgi:hypothetical protein